MKCPCYNCICVPICRHKEYNTLFQDCTIVCRFMIDINSNPSFGSKFGIRHHKSKRRDIIQALLKPTQWNIDKDGIVYDIHHEVPL